MDLANDVMLPEQWSNRRIPVTPETRLLEAIFEDALRRLRADTQAGRESMAWFESLDMESPFAFRNICDLLARDPFFWREVARRVFGKRLVLTARMVRSGYLGRMQVRQFHAGRAFL